jgi:serine protease AprX
MRLMRPEEEKNATIRSSAIWTKPDETRSSALWGKGGRGFIGVLALVVALMAPATGFAHGGDDRAFVPADLLAQARSNPAQKFDVIIQSDRGHSTSTAASRVRDVGGSVGRKFHSITGASARLSGRALLALARKDHILAITVDAPAYSTYENGEMWRETTHIDALWSYLDPLTGLGAPAPQAPAIAIVDSGVDATRLQDFGTRLLAQVNLSSLAPGATGDGQGHGTMVAGIAAGASPAYPGVAQNAPLVSIRTSDAHGQSVTSDVIAAADWILANKNAYNIRVANFSLAGSVETSFRFDPLDKAVERLWFAGVVVVAAAGNHGTEDGADVSMSYAPGNDPFIITVGALDQQQTADPYDDSVAWWSGKGYNMDGFYKPDMAAPGRYLVMPVPMGATIPKTVPERVVAPGYMWMSGTSFAAPIVAGAAAQLLALHPDWGPDEVKGALMLSATYLSDPGAGVGGIDASVAASFDFMPPNPNENFYAFVETDPATGYRFFNEASWSSYLTTQRASWSSANWASASWASASWASASWASASWSSANWSSNVEATMTSTANWHG